MVAQRLSFNDVVGCSFRHKGKAMKRREFIAMLGGVAVAWPHAARAEQPRMPVIGYLGVGSPRPLRDQLASLYRGLKETGYIEGQNVTIEYRWAEGQYDRLSGLATELVQRSSDRNYYNRRHHLSTGRKGGHHDDTHRLHQRHRPD